MGKKPLDKEKLREKHPDIGYLLEAIWLCRENSKGEFGVSGSIKCPKCGSNLFYSVSVNGHLCGGCETVGCLVWMG